MSKHPAPDRRIHLRFCTVERWQIVTDAAGRPVSHHATYKLAVPSGEAYRTRISHPINRTTYAPSMWAHILRDQLHVTPDEFWSCVDDGVLPDRGAIAIPDAALPIRLVSELVHTLGLSREQIVGVTKEQAVELIAEYWQTQ